MMIQVKGRTYYISELVIAEVFKHNGKFYCKTKGGIIEEIDELDYYNLGGSKDEEIHGNE